MTWKRARKPEQKEMRRLRILEAAGMLFDEWEFNDISMKEIADKAELGKASLYHYFKTKEEVFLALYKLELDRWVQSIVVQIEKISNGDHSQIAKAFTKAARANERFCGLSAIFSMVLEKNVSLPFMRDFKRSLVEPVEKVTILLMSKLPRLGDEQARYFVFQHHSLIAGLWGVAHPGEIADRALQLEELDGFRIDFFDVFEESIEKILAGTD